MHIYISGIGGMGLAPLALIAKKLGYQVSGSDSERSTYTDNLVEQGIPVTIGQTTEQISAVHSKTPIDWYVYSSALPLNDPNHPEMLFVKENSIKSTKRDELLNKILSDHSIKLLGVAGTHGKTTVTAMCVWLLQQLDDIPFGYSIGGKVPFGPMGDVQEGAKWFIYEADEFDRNFLNFHPALSVITGIAYDHHEIYKTAEDYYTAFRDYIKQSVKTTIWAKDSNLLYEQVKPTSLRELKTEHKNIKLVGKVNRQNATLAVHAISQITGSKIDDLIDIVNAFPGVSRRYEVLVPGLVTDYAHTPEKIAGALQMALEQNKNVVVVHEPLTNQRQHHVKQGYANLFNRVKKLYWVPSYLAREPAELAILTPAELIDSMNNPEIAEPAKLNADLKAKIDQHLKDGDLVIALTGGGAKSLDTWLRDNFI